MVQSGEMEVVMNFKGLKDKLFTDVSFLHKAANNDGSRADQSAALDVNQQSADEAKKIEGSFILPTQTLTAPAEHMKAKLSMPSSVNMFKHFLQSYYNSHDAIIGVDIIPGHIRLCQMEMDGGKRKLINLASAEIPGEVTTKDLYEHIDLYSAKLKELLKNHKISAKNAAVAIPVSEAVIKTITIPSMTDAEIEQAISFGSFWENLVQLPGELADYSVFYEVVKRNAENQTMDVLFVGSRKSDIAVYTKIISDAGLNPLIVDVRCFALNYIYHVNANKLVDEAPVAFLKFGPDENYVHIIDEGESFMYDIYISDEDRVSIMDHFNDVEILQRYAGQARQIIASHESREGSHKVSDIFVVSLLPSIGAFVGKLSSILTEYKVSECNFFDHITIPEKFLKTIEMEQNRSAWAVAMGLAARRFDVFDENKGVLGADNVNLLPENETVKETKKVSLLTIFSLVPIAIICVMIAFYSYTSAVKEKTEVAGELVVLSDVNNNYPLYEKKLNELKRSSKQLISLEAIKYEFSSNQDSILAAYKTINSSMPEGVWLTDISFAYPSTITISGNSTGDQNVLALVKDLKTNAVFSKASLKTLQVNSAFDANALVKSFTIICEMALPEKESPAASLKLGGK